MCALEYASGHKAVHAGLQGILVRTGKYCKGDEDGLFNNSRCENDITAVVDYILKNC